MQTLFTELSSMTNASYHYTNVTNLLRMCRFNQEQFKERVLETSYRLPNEHPLVQLVEFMQIDPHWTSEELEQVIEFKRERWASSISAVGVYNNGKLHQNVLYKQGYRELLISLPSQLNFTDYLITNTEDICPFIPVYSDSTELDFRPTKDKPREDPDGKFAIIGIDFTALAVGYWRYLKDAVTYGFDPKPHLWLPKFPLLNAQLLGNRLVTLNALYQHTVTGRDFDELLTVPRTTYAINSVERLLVKTVEKMDNLLTKKPLRNLDALIDDLEIYDTLPNFPNNPVVWKDPEQYGLYLKSRWVWNFSYMKVLTVLFHYNQMTRTNNGFLQSHVRRWLRQDVKLSTQQIRDPLLEKRYIAMRNELEKRIQ